jgi:GlcNAc-P-P-Und epimerase
LSWLSSYPSRILGNQPAERATIMNARAIIFGGSGFIGTRLVRRLVEAGETELLSVDLLPPRERLPGVDYRIGDVRDLSVFDMPQGVERIYNFAAVHTTPGHPTHEYYETNVLGAVEVTRLCERHDIREIVFTSSISVYGPGEDTKVETTPPAPQSAYGYSKLLAERIHRRWQEAGAGRRLVVVRPAVVFGHGERGNFTRLAKLLRKGFFIYPGRKDTIKACIYVDDLLASIDYARSLAQPFVLFNAAYPDRYTLQQIVEAMTAGYFPGVRTYLVPRPIVSIVAALLAPFKAMDIGIHPERVLKLVRSTDIYPEWLMQQGRKFPDAINSALQRWNAASGGRFD